MHRLHFLPEVEDDAFAAYVWYEAKSTGLGEDLLRMFYAKAGEISRNPLLFTRVHKEFRRCLLRRFPYAIYFTVTDGTILILGLFHCARDPQGVTAASSTRHA